MYNFEREIEQIRNSLPPTTNEPVKTDVPKKRHRLNQENVNISVGKVCEVDFH